MWEILNLRLTLLTIKDGRRTALWSCLQGAVITDASSIFFPSFPLFTEIKQVRFNNFKVSIQESESLRKNGIMIPSPWRGGYQSFLNLLSPLPPNYRTKVNHLLADEQLQLAFLAPTRTSVMEPSSTSSRLLTVTTSSSFDSLEEDH
ncbi:unnamed protein product, partial [Arabidopsis halleri]